MAKGKAPALMLYAGAIRGPGHLRWEVERLGGLYDRTYNAWSLGRGTRAEQDELWELHEKARRQRDRARAELKAAEEKAKRG